MWIALTLKNGSNSRWSRHIACGKRWQGFMPWVTILGSQWFGQWKVSVLLSTFQTTWPSKDSGSCFRAVGWWAGGREGEGGGERGRGVGGVAGVAPCTTCQYNLMKTIFLISWTIWNFILTKKMNILHASHYIIIQWKIANRNYCIWWLYLQHFRANISTQFIFSYSHTKYTKEQLM